MTLAMLAVRSVIGFLLGLVYLAVMHGWQGCFAAAGVPGAAMGSDIHSLQSLPFAKAEILMTSLSHRIRPDRKVEIVASAFDGRRRPIAVG